MTTATVRNKSALPISQQDWRTDLRPLVSVVCPTFNQEKFIGPCLDSILAQITPFRVEIIVHDDASTDGTTAIVQDYSERYPEVIKAIFQKVNQYSQGRNVRPIMLGEANGVFVASCDGDDMWLDHHKLRKQVDFLLYNPSFVLSFHDAVIMSADGQPSSSYVIPDRGRRDYSQAELRVLQWGWMLMGTVMHRNIKLDFPPEYDLVPNGDNFTPMLLGSFGAAKFQPDVAPLGYRQHPDAAWSAKTPVEKAKMQLQTYFQIASYFVRIGETEAARKIIVSKLKIRMNEFLDLTARETG